MADSSFEKGLTELAKMKVADLKAELKQRGLPTTGNKNELVERLQLAIHDSSLSLDENADEILDEDAVLDDEELETEELNNTKPDSQVQPQKRKAPVEENKTPAKKVILNRNNKIEEVKTDDAQKKEEEQKNDKPAEEVDKVIKLSNVSNETKTNDDKEEKDTAESEKKVIKLIELTATERLEMRAKKFGVPLTDTAKKEVRAARFNSNSNNSSKSASSIKNAVVPASYELLKKRAERFGTNVSSLLDKAELESKKEQRKARFGEIKPLEKVTPSKIKLVK